MTARRRRQAGGGLQRRLGNDPPHPRCHGLLHRVQRRRDVHADRPRPRPRLPDPARAATRVPFVSGTPRRIQLGGVAGIPPDAVAVTGNLTVTGQTARGYVSMTTASTSTPAVSTINVPRGDTRANGLTIKLNRRRQGVSRVHRRDRRRRDGGPHLRRHRLLPGGDRRAALLSARSAADLRHAVRRSTVAPGRRPAEHRRRRCGDDPERRRSRSRAT